MALTSEPIKAKKRPMNGALDFIVLAEPDNNIRIIDNRDGLNTALRLTPNETAHLITKLAHKLSRLTREK